jgi:hypothetical protein
MHMRRPVALPTAAKLTNTALGILIHSAVAASPQPRVPETQQNHQTGIVATYDAYAQLDEKRAAPEKLAAHLRGRAP